MNEWKTLYEVKGPKSILEMTATELKEALKETDTVILTFGAIENHSFHLPMGADYFQGNVLIRRVYEELMKLGIKSVPGFAVPFGVETNKFERDHLFGNCCVSQATFIAMVKDLVLSLHRHGFNKFVLCINHSENNGALHVAAKDLADIYDIKSIVTDWVPPMNDFWPTVLKNKEHQGHGGEDETACVMAAVPNLVNVENAKPYYAEPDKHEVKFSGLHYYGGAVGIYMPVKEDASPGYIGDPKDATAEEGILCYDAYAKWIAEVVQKYFFS